MDSHAAAIALNAVENNVVSFRTDLGKFVRIVQERKVLRFGSGKRMMDRVPFVVFRAPLHERKIRHPEEVPDVRARHGTSPSIWRTGLACNRAAQQVLD